MDIDMHNIGKRIKLKRKELQLTQTDIFELCGIRSGVLSRIENGTSTPSITLFYKIVRVLDCDINWLITGDSANIKNLALSEYEKNFIKKLRQLDEDEQDELMGLLELKLLKVKRTNKHNQNLT